MKQDEIQRVYDDAMATWGYEAQLKVLAEECAELIQAIMKRLNNRENNLDEELIDVEIMLEQIMVYIESNSDIVFQSIKEDKINRLRKRLER